MTGTDIVLAAAVILGPILAVVVARYMERRRTQREQRMDIFRALMRTRLGTARTSFDHVAALNLVEIEFRNDKVVHDAWEEHMNILNSRSLCDTVASDQSLAKLLHLISRTLGYTIEGLDIFKGGYTPQSWDTRESEAEWQSIRKYFIALSEGNKVLPVKVLESTIPQKDR